MNTELRVKWLLYVLNKNNNRGFTFWELIIILFILGLLAAIALPSFLSQPSHRHYPEAKQYTSAINKAQQAYYTENGQFITQNTPAAWASLGVGIKTQTSIYKYLLSPNGKNGVHAFAIPLGNHLKGYQGVVGLVQDPNNPRKKISQAIVCENNKNGEAPIPGEVTATEVKCGSNSTVIK